MKVRNFLLSLCLFGKKRTLTFPLCFLISLLPCFYRSERSYFFTFLPSLYFFSFSTFSCICVEVGQDEFKSITLIYCQALWAWYIGKTEASRWNFYSGCTSWWYNSFNFDFFFFIVVKTWEICLYNLGQIIWTFQTLIQFLYKVAVLSGSLVQYLWTQNITQLSPF